MSLIFRMQSCYTYRRFYFNSHRSIAFPIAILPCCAEVAQLAEHSPEKAGVGSSILPLGTIFLFLRHSRHIPQTLHDAFLKRS